MSEATQLPLPIQQKRVLLVAHDYPRTILDIGKLRREGTEALTAGSYPEAERILRSRQDQGQPIDLVIGYDDMPDAPIQELEAICAAFQVSFMHRDNVEFLGPQRATPDEVLSNFRESSPITHELLHLSR